MVRAEILPVSLFYIQVRYAVRTRHVELQRVRRECIERSVVETQQHVGICRCAVGATERQAPLLVLPWAQTVAEGVPVWAKCHIGLAKVERHLPDRQPTFVDCGSEPAALLIFGAIGNLPHEGCVAHVHHGIYGHSCLRRHQNVEPRFGQRRADSDLRRAAQVERVAGAVNAQVALLGQTCLMHAEEGENLLAACRVAVYHSRAKHFVHTGGQRLQVGHGALVRLQREAGFDLGFLTCEAFQCGAVARRRLCEFAEHFARHISVRMVPQLHFPRSAVFFVLLGRNIRREAQWCGAERKRAFCLLCLALRAENVHADTQAAAAAQLLGRTFQGQAQSEVPVGVCVHRVDGAVLAFVVANPPAPAALLYREIARHACVAQRHTAECLGATRHRHAVRRGGSRLRRVVSCFQPEGFDFRQFNVERGTAVFLYADRCELTSDAYPKRTRQHVIGQAKRVLQHAKGVGRRFVLCQRLVVGVEVGDAVRLLCRPRVPILLFVSQRRHVHRLSGSVYAAVGEDAKREHAVALCRTLVSAVP